MPQPLRVLMPKSLPAEEKLAALRAAQPIHQWQSLGDRVQCVLCEKTFSGRQIEATSDGRGKVRLHCPSEGCPATPNEWIHPGNPLVSRQAWSDWEKILDGNKSLREPASRGPGRRHASL